MNALLNPFQIGEMIIDNSVKVLEAVATAQEHGEKMMGLALDQNRQLREHGMKVAKSMLEQARENQKQASNLMNGAVRASLDAFKIVGQQSVSDYSKQVEQITRDVEALQKSAKK